MAPIRALQLVTTPRSFFDQQVRMLEERGIECTVVEVPRPENGRGPGEFARFYRRVLREALFGNYDLVHANYGLVGPIALAQPVRPVILSIWGSEVMGYSNRLDYVTRFAARHSDAVIAPSAAVSRELDVPHTIVPFGIDTDLFRPINRDEAREYLGWDLDERIVLFPYDPDRAVKNYPLAERVIDRLSTTAKLHTVSGLAYEEMPYVMNASDALLVTSERESGPMVVKEAAACNLPVVSTDVGFVSDVLKGVSNCFIGESADVLACHLDSILERGQRADGRDVVDGLALNEMGDRLLTLYTTSLRL
jgi:glycosyltransferase involved in cell wall biosynthesis